MNETYPTGTLDETSVMKAPAYSGLRFDESGVGPEYVNESEGLISVIAKCMCD